jgi:arylsulfatase A
MKHNTICLLTVLLATTDVHPALLTSSEAAPSPNVGLPNIVFVMADDMGYGDAGCYNPDSKIPTPHIDRLAREGMRFTDAHAPGSVCVPSRYGLLTGRYPFRQHISWNMGRANLQPSKINLASLLKQQGYRTVGVGKWHLGFTCDHPTEAGQRMPGGPVDVGFDSSFGMWASLDIPPYYYFQDGRCVQPPSEKIEASPGTGPRSIQGPFWRAGGIAPGLRHEDVMPTFVKKTVEHIDQHAGQSPEKPLFVYFPLPAPHTPWVPTAALRGKSRAGEYGDYTVEVDNAVGSVIEALQKHDMFDNTLFVFTADNGPVWYAEDVDRYGHRSSGPLRGMKGDIWEGGHRVPFVVRWPGQVKKNTTSDALICFTDMLATFAAVTGQDLPKNAKVDSVNFLPVLLGKNDDSPRDTLLHTGGKMIAIRRGPWKLIPGLGSFGFSDPKREKPMPGGPKGQLYNLTDDPGETTNRWLDEPELVKELSELLKSSTAK